MTGGRDDAEWVQVAEVGENSPPIGVAKPSRTGQRKPISLKRRENGGMGRENGGIGERKRRNGERKHGGIGERKRRIGERKRRIKGERKRRNWGEKRRIKGERSRGGRERTLALGREVED
jgi:hypothetical protein